MPHPFLSRWARVLALCFAPLLTGVAHAQTASVDSLGVDDSPSAMQALIEAAKKEGSLQYYATHPAKYLPLLIEPFEKKYGIKVNVWRTSSENVLARTLNEARAGHSGADMVEAIAPPIEALRRENLLMKVAAPNQKDLIPGRLPAHHQWVTNLRYILVQAYNTNKVLKSDLPKTYADLLDPKWKGKLAIEANDHEWVSSVIDSLGEAEGMRVFSKLFADNQMSVRSGHSLLNGLVASGEVPLALTVYQDSAAQQKAKGAPIDWFVIDAAISVPNATAILKTAPHPHAALLFYDYMISPDAQRVLARSDYYPSNAKVEPPALRKVKTNALDPAQLLDNQQSSDARFQTLQKQIQR
jgi:iron(III) transport system substrate-binding protein